MDNYVRLWKTIAPTLPVDKSPLHIIYYSGRDARSFGVRLPEWGGGGAIGRDTIVIPLDRVTIAGMDAARVTVHELVHIVLARTCGIVPVPRWFHEGLAMTLSGELLFDEQVILSRAIFTRRLMTFEAMEKVNTMDRYGAALAYSQAHCAVALLIGDYGTDTLRLLLDAARTTGSFDSAMARVIGYSVREWETFAREDLVKRYSLVFLISDTALYWLPVTFLFIAAFIAVTVRNRRKRRQMEEEERAGGGGGWE
jgi:hypothetical protein